MFVFFNLKKKKKKKSWQWTEVLWHSKSQGVSKKMCHYTHLRAGRQKFEKYQFCWANAWVRVSRNMNVHKYVYILLYPTSKKYDTFRWKGTPDERKKVSFQRDFFIFEKCLYSSIKKSKKNENKGWLRNFSLNVICVMGTINILFVLLHFFITARQKVATSVVSRVCFFYGQQVYEAFL